MLFNKMWLLELNCSVTKPVVKKKKKEKDLLVQQEAYVIAFFTMSVLY